MFNNHPLVLLYGEEALDLTLGEIQLLAQNSNIPFDNKFIELGISFLIMKANQIIDDEKKKIDLTSLVSESFGEASIYKYNINEGTL